MRNQCWNFESTRQYKLLREIQYNEKQKRLKINKWYTKVIQEKRNCTKEEASEVMSLYKKKGFPNSTFILSGKYKDKIEDLKTMERYEKPATDCFVREKNEMYRRLIMDDTGWSETEVRLRFRKARVNCGCTLSEYYAMRLYKKSDEEQKNYITNEIFLRLAYRYCDYVDGLKFFQNKVLFNERFRKYVKRKWFKTEGLSYETFLSFFKSQNEIIYKPDNLALGVGVKKYFVSQHEEVNKNIYKEVTIDKKGIIEEVIKQHPIMEKLNSEAVSSIRVQTIVKNGKVNFLNTTLRTAMTHGQCNDNLASGGGAANVDIKTGIIVTDAVTKAGEKYEYHPITGVRFKGLKIPSWNKVLNTCAEAALEFKNMPYIGWDVAINSYGEIELIEGNSQQDAVFHQLPWAVCEGKGIRKTVDKYVWFGEEDRTV